MLVRDPSKIMVPPTASLREILTVIDATALGFALVVDGDRRLLGTVTDGDIRRNLLRSDVPGLAQDVMNSHPITMPIESGEDEQHALLTERKIAFLPLIDGERRVVAIALASHPPGFKNDDVCVVIMAGGLGSRLGDLTKITPKPLLHVDGEPILERIIKRFRDDGFADFILCVNYKAEMIREAFGDGSRLGVRIDYVEEKKRLGTGGALSLIEREKFRRYFVTNADILCSTSYRELLEFHADQKAIATMAVHEHTVEIPFGVVETDGFEFRSLREKPSYTYFVNAGVYVVEQSALAHVPHNEFFDMPTIFDLLHKDRKRTRIFPTQGSWIDIGRPEDLERAHSLFKK